MFVVVVSPTNPRAPSILNLQKDKAAFSEGASGAFMVGTADKQVIIKTLEKGEAEVCVCGWVWGRWSWHLTAAWAQTLERMLNAYALHMADPQNADSLLVKFLGAYRLTLYHRTIWFVAMVDIFGPHVQVDERYDLKGSWVNRSGATPGSGVVATCRCT